MGDPPMEEQGLYSVFDSDSSTWKVINAFIKTNGELKIEN
jgi:mannan endo-1,4-beta-mannosidase